MTIARGRLLCASFGQVNPFIKKMGRDFCAVFCRQSGHCCSVLCLDPRTQKKAGYCAWSGPRRPAKRRERRGPAGYEARVRKQACHSVCERTSLRIQDRVFGTGLVKAWRDNRRTRGEALCRTSSWEKRLALLAQAFDAWSALREGRRLLRASAGSIASLPIAEGGLSHRAAIVAHARATQQGFVRRWRAESPHTRDHMERCFR